MLVFNALPDPVGIVTSVRQQACAFGEVLEEQLGHRCVMSLAGGQFELQGKAMLVHAQMQLGGQSSTATTDTSISTLFFCAAACW